MLSKNIMGKMKKSALFMIVFLYSFIGVKADICVEYGLLDGSENLSSYGLDTTSNWWAITEPYPQRYRLWVNNKSTPDFLDVSVPVFSPSGDKWVSFGSSSSERYLITQDTIFPIKSTKGGQVVFSSNSTCFAYTYFQNDVEHIIYGSNKIEITNRVGPIMLSDNGKIVIMGQRNSRYVLNINGAESTVFDEIIPIGFKQNGKFFYAARNGIMWEFYENDKGMGYFYKNVFEVRINKAGDVAAALVQLPSGNFTGVLFSDEYYEPMLGREYDGVMGLNLHPYLPLIAYKAKKDLGYIIVQNTAEYSVGATVSVPRYTHDGEDLYYFGCDMDCFVNINGNKITLPNIIYENNYFAMKPGSKTIGYTTSAGLQVQFVERNKTHQGLMVDKTSSARYNWKNKRYEALGSINNRLFLLTCAPD